MSLPARHGAADVAESEEYRGLVARIRERIDTAQTRAAAAVNTELVLLYWSIGREILDQQERSGWGDDVVGQLAADLKSESGSARGFSRRNLFYMRRFAALWTEYERVQPLAAQIGWTHHQVLLDAFGDDAERYAWYAAKAADGRWSRRHLKAQIDLRLHERQGAGISNARQSLPDAEARNVLEAIKDPYVFDFLTLGDDAQERHLEQALIDDIQRFLLELGQGFAFYGRQTPLVVGGQEFFLDLLFYHHRLRRFVVIELKIGEFQPEFAGKMNFYLNAVDAQMREGDDRESVGIILCTGRNETVAELALHRVVAPIVVSTWQGGASAPAPAPALGPGDEVPADLEDELAELPAVRDRLIERVSRRTQELTTDAVDPDG